MLDDIQLLHLINVFVELFSVMILSETVISQVKVSASSMEIFFMLSMLVMMNGGRPRNSLEILLIRELE